MEDNYHHNTNTNKTLWDVRNGKNKKVRMS